MARGSSSSGRTIRCRLVNSDVCGFTRFPQSFAEHLGACPAAPSVPGMPLPASLDRWRAQLADRLPLGLREGRLAVSPAAALAVALVALFAIAGTALAVWHGRAR